MRSCRYVLLHRRTRSKIRLWRPCGQLVDCMYMGCGNMASTLSFQTLSFVTFLLVLSSSFAQEQCFSDPEFNAFFAVDEPTCCQQDVCGLPCPAPHPEPGKGTSVNLWYGRRYGCFCCQPFYSDGTEEVATKIASSSTTWGRHCFRFLIVASFHHTRRFWHLLGSLHSSIIHHRCFNDLSR
jgi:hypothetical protein